MKIRAIWALVAWVTACAAAIAQPITPEQKQDLLKAIEGVITGRAYVPGIDLKRWPEHLAKQQADIDKAETQADFIRSVNRAIREFGISHIRLRSPEARQSRQTVTSVGIGLSTRVEEGKGLAVVDVAPESPAEASGLRPGDLIIEIDGQMPDSREDVQGAEGSPITLKIRRGEEEFELSMRRERINMRRPETLVWVKPGVAHIRVWTFSNGYSRENVERIMRDASAAQAIILDLRSNGGGALSNLRHLMSYLLPPDTVLGTPLGRGAAVKMKEGEDAGEPDLAGMAADQPNKVRTTKRGIDPFAGKIAVLVNRGSASCSEIAAAALREHLSAPLIGSQTAGAVLFSGFARLPHGFEIQYPSADFVTAKGERLEAHPLRPDVYAPTPRKGDTDRGIEAAIHRLGLDVNAEEPASTPK